MTTRIGTWLAVLAGAAAVAVLGNLGTARMIIMM